MRISVLLFLALLPGASGEVGGVLPGRGPGGVDDHLHFFSETAGAGVALQEYGRSRTGMDAGGGDPGSGVRLAAVETKPPVVRTGDTLRLVVVLDVPSGLTLRVPDTLPLPPGLAGRGRVSVTTEEDGGRGSEGGESRRIILGYPLQALAPGRVPLPPFKARVRRDEVKEEPGGAVAGAGDGWVSLPLGTLRVSSLLPSPPERVEPRPPLPPRTSPPEGTRVPLTLSFLCLALSGLGWGWTRLARGEEEVATPSGADAFRGAEAGETLDALLEAKPASSREARDLLSRALPLLRLEVAGTVGLAAPGVTTPELMAVVTEDPEAGPEAAGPLPPFGAGEAESLEAILREGEEASFGGAEPTPERVGRILDRIRAWREETRDIRDG